MTLDPSGEADVSCEIVGTDPHVPESAEAFAWYYYARHFLESPRPSWPKKSGFENLTWDEHGLRPTWLKLCRAMFTRMLVKSTGVPKPEPVACIEGIAQAAIVTPSRVTIYGYDPARVKQGCHAVPRAGWEAKPFHCYTGSNGKGEAPAAPSDLDAILFNPPDEPWLAFQCGKQDIDPSSLVLNLSPVETAAVSAGGCVRRVPLAGMRTFIRLANRADLATDALINAVIGNEGGRRAALKRLGSVSPGLLDDAFALATQYDLTASGLERFEKWNKENNRVDVV